MQIELLGREAIYLLFLSIAFILCVFGGLLWFGWWTSQIRGSLSPYTKKPMGLGVDIASSLQVFVDDFMLAHSQPENSPFEFKKAAICPVTGRIFPDCVTRNEIVKLDWTFLEKRYPGNYVSWGSIGLQQQAIIRLCHESLSGYELESSCPNPLPKDVDVFHANLKPGPLYVDLATKILLGWKEVPGTYFEVLIVQKPIYDSIDDTL